MIGSSSNPPAIPELDASQGLPTSILLETRVYFADRRNSTTATLDTGNGRGIQVSICFAAPPALSYVCIHCPGYTTADFCDCGEPRVARSEKQFLLLHLSLRGAGLFEVVHEYYMYQATIRGKPKLFRIPYVGPSFCNIIALDYFGIYCHSDDGEFILTGLVYFGGYQLYSYSSATKAWTVKPAYLDCERMLTQETVPVRAHKVILLGGSLLAWVDLWRGILVCDVLSQDPLLVAGFIPLPLTGNTEDHICPWVIRDVTCTNGTLKFIEVADLETDPCKFVDWRATIWTFKLLSGSCWLKEFEVHGSDVEVDDHLGDCTVGGSTVRNLLPSFPTMSICGDHVVHMSFPGSLDSDKMYMISIDMSNKALKALTLCPPVYADDDSPYFPCVLSNYLSNPPGKS